MCTYYLESNIFSHSSILIDAKMIIDTSGESTWRPMEDSF